MKNVVNCQQLLFTDTWQHSKFGSGLCKIRWEKHPRAFVKVVEGSEIYNFPIHHLEHFSCNFWSFSMSNSACWINSVTMPRRRAGQSAERARAPRHVASLYRRTQAEADPRLSVHASRPREVLSGHVPRPKSPPARTPVTSGPSAPFPCAHAPTEADRRTCGVMA
jgi:hypothetical protein